MARLEKLIKVSKAHAELKYTLALEKHHREKEKWEKSKGRYKSSPSVNSL